MRLYSQFSLAELQIELEQLRHEIEEKKTSGDMVHAEILEQKFYLAKSYLIGTNEFLIGKSYKVYGFDLPFTIEYFNGVFAWGRFQDFAEQTGYPVGMLESL